MASMRWVGSVIATTVVGACAGPPQPMAPGEAANQAPRFVSVAPTLADHNRPYEYLVQVEDPDGDDVQLFAEILGSWMAFDAATARVSGLAGWENRGQHAVRLRAFDGTLNTFQSFTLTVQPGEVVCDQPFGDPAESLYVLPFRVGEEYELQQGNCPPNPNWGHHNWFAYDFDTQIGDTLIASRAGTVLFTREDRPDGTRQCGQQQENFVFIRHADGTVMQYVHLTTGGALVEVGDEVAQGQPIGISGDSGCSAGPHVHVNLFHDNTNFNRQASLPFNYRNAEGPLDANNGLVGNARYVAGAFTPDGR